MLLERFLLLLFFTTDIALFEKYHSIGYFRIRIYSAANKIRLVRKKYIGVHSRHSQFDVINFIY